MVQRLSSIPAPEHVHQALVDDSGVPKSYIWLWDEGNVVQHRSWAFFLVRVHDPVDLVTIPVGVVEDLAPLVREDGVLVDVLEDLDDVQEVYSNGQFPDAAYE